MTGSLAVRDPDKIDRFYRESATLAPVQTDLAAWAQQAREASQVAVSLAKTPFVPASLRDRDDAVTVGNITAAILTGQEVGMQPMAALRALDVIQGTPAFRAITLRALVLSHGHDLWLAESTATRAIVRGRRANSTEVQESVWTLDRAKALALLGKDNWRKQAQAMLVARATAECARLVAADVIMAVPYAVEELEDGDPAAEIMPAPAEQPKRTARRRSQPTAAPTVRADAPPAPADPEPDFDEPTAEQPPADEPGADGITRAQQTKMLALFNAIGMADRDERLAYSSGVAGRDLESSSDLTKEEASRIIDRLEQIDQPIQEDTTA